MAYLLPPTWNQPCVKEEEEERHWERPREAETKVNSERRLSLEIAALSGELQSLPGFQFSSAPIVTHKQP